LIIAFFCIDRKPKPSSASKPRQNQWAVTNHLSGWVQAVDAVVQLLALQPPAPTGKARAEAKPRLLTLPNCHEAVAAAAVLAELVNHG
jgi:hypothetical protein